MNIWMRISDWLFQFKLEFTSSLNCYFLFSIKYAQTCFIPRVLQLRRQKREKRVFDFSLDFRYFVRV